MKNIIILGQSLWVCALCLGCRSAPDITMQEHVMQTRSVPSPNEMAPGPRTTELTGRVTLDQVLNQVMRYSPLIHAASLDTQIARARSRQVSLWPNPELDIEIETIGGTAPRNGFDGTETTVAVAQPVPLGFTRKDRLRVASYDTQLAKNNYERLRRQLQAKATEAFYEVMAAQAKVELAEGQCQVAQSLLDTVTQRVSAGEDSPVEENKARVTVAHSRVRLTRLHSELIQAKTRLADLWAGEPLFEGVTGAFDTVIEVPDSASLLPLIRTHPTLARWDEEINKAKALQSLADSEVYGPLALRAGLKRLEDENENTGVIGVGIPLPLFDRNQGRRAEAGYYLAKVKQHQRQAEARLKAQLAVTVQALNAVHAEAMALKNDIIPQAQTVYQSSLTGYEQGEYNYLHVLDAQRQLFEQSVREIDILLAYHQTKARLEALIGESLQPLMNNNEKL